MKTIGSIAIFVVVIVLAGIRISAAEGVTAWCGNGCSSNPDEPSGVNCTDWGKATPSSDCQAKAICSEECTVWVAKLNRNLDLILVESEQDLERLRRKLQGGLGVRTVAQDKLFRIVDKKYKEKESRTK